MKSLRWITAIGILALLTTACPGEAPTPRPSPPTEAPTSEPPSPSPEGSPTEPPEPEIEAVGSATVEHGATYWAVYLAAGDEGIPELDQAAAYLQQLGVESFPGPLDCDRGAAEGLGMPADTWVVGAYFESRHDARRFERSLPSPAAGVVRVTTYCAD